MKRITVFLLCGRSRSTAVRLRLSRLTGAGSEASPPATGGNTATKRRFRKNRPKTARLLRRAFGRPTSTRRAPGRYIPKTHTYRPRISKRPSKKLQSRLADKNVRTASTRS
jgi:hypothetical protein